MQKRHPFRATLSPFCPVHVNVAMLTTETALNICGAMPGTVGTQVFLFFPLSPVNTKGPLESIRKRISGLTILGGLRVGLEGEMRHVPERRGSHHAAWPQTRSPERSPAPREPGKRHIHPGKETFVACCCVTRSVSTLWRWSPASDTLIGSRASVPEGQSESTPLGRVVLKDLQGCQTKSGVTHLRGCVGDCRVYGRNVFNKCAFLKKNLSRGVSDCCPQETLSNSGLLRSCKKEFLRLLIQVLFSFEAKTVY